MFLKENLQLTKGPSSPLGPLRERKKGQITYMNVTVATKQIINSLLLLHIIVIKIKSILYCFFTL